MSAEVRARLEHARRLGYCARGMRRWFDGREYSWQEFIASGVPAAWLLAQNDAMARRVAELAMEESAA